MGSPRCTIPLPWVGFLSLQWKEAQSIASSCTRYLISLSYSLAISGDKPGFDLLLNWVRARYLDSNRLWDIEEKMALRQTVAELEELSLQPQDSSDQSYSLWIRSLLEGRAAKDRRARRRAKRREGKRVREQKRREKKKAAR